MENDILSKIVYSTLLAFGVVIGAGLASGISAVFMDKPPIRTMIDTADRVKVWALAISIGGTFDSFEIIERGIFKGELRVFVKQLVCILSGMAGANVAYRLLELAKKCI